MATFKIYYGAAKPMTAVGKHQCNLLAFAEKKTTMRAVQALHAKGYIEVIGDQFRFVYPSL